MVGQVPTPTQRSRPKFLEVAELSDPRTIGICINNANRLESLWTGAYPSPPRAQLAHRLAADLPGAHAGATLPAALSASRFTSRPRGHQSVPPSPPHFVPAGRRRFQLRATQSLRLGLLPEFLHATAASWTAVRGPANSGSENRLRSPSAPAPAVIPGENDCLRLPHC